MSDITDIGCLGWIILIVTLIVIFAINGAIINSDLPDWWKFVLLK